MKWKTFTLWSRGILGLLVLLLATVLVNAQSWDGRNPGRPGSLNYIEGQVSIGTQAINDQAVGSAKLEPGESVATERGKAEILLTPGAFLRLGENTSVKMISSGLTNTELQVQKGRAMVEIAELHEQNNLRVDLNGATTRLLKTGLYDFDADRNQLRVFDGKVTVQENGSQIEVKDGRDLTVNAGGSSKSGKFDKKAYGTTCTTGVVCGLSIWRRPIPMQLRPTLSGEAAGWALAGIGIPGTMPIRSFRETDSCIARSVGASTHRDLRFGLRFFHSGTFTVTLTTTIGDVAL